MLQAHSIPLHPPERESQCCYTAVGPVNRKAAKIEMAGLADEQGVALKAPQKSENSISNVFASRHTIGKLTQNRNTLVIEIF